MTWISVSVSHLLIDDTYGSWIMGPWPQIAGPHPTRLSQCLLPMCWLETVWHAVILYLLYSPMHKFEFSVPTPNALYSFVENKILIATHVKKCAAEFYINISWFAEKKFEIFSVQFVLNIFDFDTIWNKNYEFLNFRIQCRIFLLFKSINTLGVNEQQTSTNMEWFLKETFDDKKNCSGAVKVEQNHCFIDFICYRRTHSSPCYYMKGNMSISEAIMMHMVTLIWWWECSFYSHWACHIVAHNSIPCPSYLNANANNLFGFITIHHYVYEKNWKMDHFFPSQFTFCWHKQINRALIVNCSC